MRRLILLVAMLMMFAIVPSTFAQDGPEAPTLDDSFNWEARSMSINYPAEWGLVETRQDAESVTLEGPSTTIVITYADLFDVYGGYGDELLSTGLFFFDTLLDANSTDRFSIEMRETEFGILAYTLFYEETINTAYGFAFTPNDDAFTVVIDGDNLSSVATDAVFESIQVNTGSLLFSDGIVGGDISVGETVVGEIVDNEIIYNLNANPGDTLTVEMIASDPNELDTRVLVYADGLQIAENDDGFDDGTYNSRIRSVTLPPAESYNIVASRYDTFYAGEFTLSVSLASAEDTPITAGTVQIGTSIEATFGVNDIEYELVAEAGQVVTIEVLANDPDTLDPVLTLYADGVIVASNDDISLDDYNSRIESFTLPPANTYLIRVSRYNPAVQGGFVLTITGE